MAILLKYKMQQQNNMVSVEVIFLTVNLDFQITEIRSMRRVEERILYCDIIQPSGINFSKT
jgi:hypothetical protein